jgi:phosphate transport system substrate-binding protein
MKLKKSLHMAIIAFLGVAVFSLAVACGGDDDDNGGTTGAAQPTAAATGATGATSASGDGAVSGAVEIDGSSTVFPITEAVAEEFGKENSGVRVTVGISGTGGGFKRFCAGETDISDASRPIKKEEADICAAAGIDFIEIPVAYDGLSVVVNHDNDWATCITTAELKTLWQPEAEGKITKWSQVRASWPDEEITLYGPGTDSGTFDYFTETINGKAQASRADFTASEDDNILVQGVAGDEHALGYFGLAYLEENADKIKGVEIDGGKGCVAPTQATVEDGTYAPLSRPLFIYVKAASVDKPQVKAFVDYYLENVPELSADVGYVKFPDNFYVKITEIWTGGTTGTIFSGASGSVGEILGVN